MAEQKPIDKSYLLTQFRNFEEDVLKNKYVKHSDISSSISQTPNYNIASFNSDITLSSLFLGLPIPFNNIMYDNDIEWDEENQGFVLKSGKTYELEAVLRSFNGTGYLYYIFYNITDNIEFGVLGCIETTKLQNATQIPATAIITPDKDIIVRVQLHSVVGTTFSSLTLAGQSRFKVIELNGNLICDTSLSETSENPVQNKVITQKLNEVFQSVSNGKSLIASAITDKGVETASDATFEVMAENILSISSGGEYKCHPDIFNHGDVVGLSPMHNFYQEKHQSGFNSWIVSSSKIYVPYSANANLVFGSPMVFTGYKYLCFDVEVPSGANGNYNISTIGLRKASNGWQTSEFGCVNHGANLTMYGNQTNYDGTSPWYTLTRQIIKISVADLTDAYVLAMHNCDCEVNIYSIWLE